MSADERIQLVGGPMLVGVAFAFGSLMAAVLPTRHEFARTVDHGPDGRSLSYLRVLTRASPGDEELARLYVRQLSALGEFDAALAALGGAAARADGETEDLRLDLLLARARALPVGSPARVEAFGAVERQLEVLRGMMSRPSAGSAPQSAERTDKTAPRQARAKELASLALELERPRLGAEFLLDLAAVTPDAERAPVLADAGRWMLAAGDHARAASCYRQAAAQARDAATAGEYARSAIESLEAGDDVQGAADLAATYAAEYADVEWFDLAARLAVSANRAVAARDWGRRALALRPDDPARLRDQVRRELAARDSRGALALLRKLVALEPDDARLHVAEARIAEWAGDPEQALADWLWLVDRGRDPAAPLDLP